MARTSEIHIHTTDELTDADEREHGLRLGFNRSLRIDFARRTVTSDGGLLVYKEAAYAIGVEAVLEECFSDIETGAVRERTHSEMENIRQSIYQRAAGKDDLNEAEDYADDAAMRAVVGDGVFKDRCSSQSHMARFETEVMAEDANFGKLEGSVGAVVDRIQDVRQELGLLESVSLDLDGTFYEVFGNQQGAKYNRHARCVCYRPLKLLNNFGDLEGCLLRPGNVHDATDWERLLKPAVDRYKKRDIPIDFRADAAFAKPKLYKYLEDEEVDYAIRMKTNTRLSAAVNHLHTKPEEKPDDEPDQIRYSYAETDEYGARSWKCTRRIVSKAEWHGDDFFPKHIYYIVTNMKKEDRSAEEVFAFYHKRGTAERFIKEAKNAIKMTRMSCMKFRSNEVRLNFHALAYNIANATRTLVLPGEIGHWSLTTIHEKMVKTGARVVHHARTVTFRLAEVAIDRHLYRKIFARIDDIRRTLAEAVGEPRRRRVTA